MSLNKHTKPKHFIIYTFTNKINDKVYIGLTTDLKQRLSHHKRKDGKTYFDKAKRKYGLDNFKFEIIDDLATSFDELVEKEKMYIRLYKEIGFELYNLTDGGEGTVGIKMSEESLKKLSDSHKGQKAWNKGMSTSLAVKKKISSSMLGKPSPNKGKKQSEETKKKLSDSHKGQKAWNKGISTPEETKKKISKANKNKIISEETIKLKRIIIRDKKIKNGKFLGVYNNNNSYQAVIKFKRKKYYLGVFDVPEFAAAAYDRKAIELYGPDAVTNFPIANYTQEKP